MVSTGSCDQLYVGGGVFFWFSCLLCNLWFSYFCSIQRVFFYNHHVTIIISFCHSVMTLYMRKTGRHAESEQYNKELKKKKTSEKLENTPTLGHSQAPPLDIARVTSSTFQGGGGDRSRLRTLCIGFQYRDKFKGGGGDHPCPPLDPPLLSETKKLGETKAERTTYHHNALLTSKSYYNVS